MSDVRVGCSGWAYPHWVGPVYPADASRRQWFETYAERFDTVELNNTFYQLPSASTVDDWADRAPEGFVYSPKLGQYCTHRKKLKDPDQWLGHHLDRIRRLGDHGGPNLVQLPPRWHRNVERLDEFLERAPDDVRWAVEVRDATWLHDDVFECLDRHGAALCLHDLLPDHPVVLTTDWVYVRFHGPDAVEHAYQGRYGPDRLATWVDRIGRWRDDGVAVWAYFNNDQDADAVEDADWLRDALS